MIQSCSSVISPMPVWLARNIVPGCLLPRMAPARHHAKSLPGPCVYPHKRIGNKPKLHHIWSLSAFWFIYTRDKRYKMAKRANKAEIEIWSGRIEELQQSLEQT